MSICCAGYVNACFRRAATGLLLLFAMLPFLHAQDRASYVGNKACARCHTEIYRRYAATPMAMSSGRELPPLTAGSFTHAASQVRYEIRSDGEVRLSRGDARETRRLSYYFGSGAAGRSFGYLHEGFLFEAPVTWYTQTGGW